MNIFNGCSLVQLKKYKVNKYKNVDVDNQHFNFLILKGFCPYISFWGAPTHADIIEYSNFLLQLNNQRLGGKALSDFSTYHFNFKMNYDIGTINK